MGSTGAGEAVDTIIFCAIAAPVVGITSFGQWCNYAFFGFLWKTLVEYACIPITTRIIAWIKKTRAKLSGEAGSGPELTRYL
ncbi:preQ0 transporter [Cutibacterium acnes JCM 18916]|nr:preQ0 transporter [Cutibacterium acnes JCM 18916]